MAELSSRKFAGDRCFFDTLRKRLSSAIRISARTIMRRQSDRSGRDRWRCGAQHLEAVLKADIAKGIRSSARQWPPLKSVK